MISIKIKHIVLSGYLLLIASTIVFFLTWLHWYFGVFATLAVLFAFFRIARNMGDDDREIIISKTMLTAIIIIVLAWVLLSGVGGAFPQKSDMNWRNAIFHDLIRFSWPVRYSDGYDSSLTYYFAFWLIPSMIGKSATLIFGSPVGWISANIATILYCTLMIVTVVLLLIGHLNCKSRNDILTIIVILILFSGMDLLGAVLNHNSLPPGLVSGHLEWWTYIEYSSNTSQLGWVYNQAIPTWLVMALLINERNLKHYALLGTLLIPFGPIPFIGVTYLMVVEGVRQGVQLFRNHRGGHLAFQVFSLPNLIGCLVILPVFYLFYTTNSTASGHGGALNYFNFVLYLEFVLLEFVFILFLVWKPSYQSPFFISSAVGLFIIPLFKFGSAQDFCMRASIPLLFILMLYTMSYLINIKPIPTKISHNSDKKAIALIIVLVIGAATPLNEYRDSYLQIKESGGHCTSIFADKFKTLDNGQMERDNFITKYASDTFFYRYLAKGDKK